METENIVDLDMSTYNIENIVASFTGNKVQMAEY